MKAFVDSIRQSIEQKNWYGALIVALTIPDICGRLRDPQMKSGDRFVAWFDEFVGHKYRSKIGAFHQEHVFLSGNDCYALRCAFLHEARDNITLQKARDSLERFHFIKPPEKNFFHCNQFNNVLQLQVDQFCKDMCDGADSWLDSVTGDLKIQERMKDLAKIYDTPTPTNL